jgi:hypothetical protein
MAEMKEVCAERSAGGTSMPNHRIGSFGAWLSSDGVLSSAPDSKDGAESEIPGSVDASAASASFCISGPEDFGVEPDEETEKVMPRSFSTSFLDMLAQK